MGIGDVTRPIVPAVIDALHKAVDEMGTAEGFHGYGPEQGYAFLREVIAEKDFKDFVGYDTPAYSRYSTNPVYQNAPSMMMIFSENASKLDAGIMVENVAVCAKGIGLDSVIILSIRQLFDSPNGNKWKKFLSIPENYQFDIAISIGHGNEKPEKKPRNEEQFKIIK